MLLKQSALVTLLLLCCLSLHAQKDKAVKGRITDATTGNPLRGVRISYKELTAAITDSVGNFTIQVPSYDVSIHVESEGYQAKEIALKGKSQVTAALYETDYTSFYSDITIPFTRTSRSAVAGAATSITANDTWGAAPETPDSYLQGKVAGLNAIRRSGTPGMGANLFLRGFTSLYATNQPLIVVDGIIFDIDNYGSSLVNGYYNNPLSLIDLRDIDNITVLKDGASVYGTKGANGVILITTARARQEATKIDVALYGGVNVAPATMPVMNAADYRIYLSEMLQSQGLTGNQIQALPYMNDDKTSPDYYPNHYQTNWQKQVLHNSAVQNLYMKITGGDNIARYGLSVGFLKNNGVIKSTGLSRYNMRFNGDFNLSKKLTATANLGFTYYEQQLKNMGIDAHTNPLLTALVKSPFLPIHEVAASGAESPNLADADVFHVSNPTALIQSMSAQNKSYRFSGSINFNYQLTRQIALSTAIGVTMDKSRETFFVPQKGVVSDTLENAVAKNRSGAQVIRMFSLFNDTRLTYSNVFQRKHTLSARLGVRYLKGEAEQDYGLGYNAATDKLTGIGYGLNSLRRIGGSIGDWKWVNGYANVDYNLSGKYFLSLNVAADASSRFGSNTGTPVMPSLSAAWLLSSENFMAGTTWLDMLKLRASAGKTGNDDIGNFTARKYYVSQNLLGVSGLVRGNTGNPNLQWEAVTRLNAGVDIAILNERVSMSADVYTSKTNKMIVYEPATTVSGMDYIVTNSGAMKTNGWELAMNARIINNKSLKWDMGFTLSHYTSKVTQLPVDAIETAYADGAYITRAGGAPNLFYGYKTAGVYSSDAQAASEGLMNKMSDGSYKAFAGGDVRFANTTTDDKNIDAGDRQVIGNPNPKYTGGITSRVVWKQWSLDALFTFSQGNDIYNYTRRQLESMSGYANQLSSVNNRWRNNGQQTNMPKATWGDAMGNSRFSDRWIEDGSYFRLRNVNIAYNVPLPSGFVKNMTVYASATNLFTLTKYLGYDPEFDATSSVYGQGVDVTLTPLYKTFQMGVRLGL
ncbi:TonB-linked outer membrane protein, SusC/RagA family [Filimonas lacunae]|uniref:TonB-linked outer membrane protein, SusC/RagA family n=1 Tax=Filimonas lacunae TaxID=477680 RepID=A0A173MAM5_9BACT|nr:SusC/RagA family TonB-linked outer membrane protein [Filimonas lacunae]BAV04559.1 outer membrane protein, nutrient binding [Filimonas lacunae]SIT34769.1 TonB-linked outer membrane protein, SusC/RagA family [Filimonas lacunae]